MLLGFLIILIIILLIWAGILTYFFLQLRTNYHIFTSNGDKKTFDTVISSLVRELHSQKKILAELQSRCDRIEKEEAQHIQKIGLLRFNPFKDTGGDQSFII